MGDSFVDSNLVIYQLDKDDANAGDLVYLAPSRVNLNLTQERWPKVQFLATREVALA